jgi:hypothetical protein
MDTQTGSDRVERAARNQTLFRQVNERLEELATAFKTSQARPCSPASAPTSPASSRST